mgnify:CR=1 FL=1
MKMGGFLSELNESKDSAQIFESHELNRMSRMVRLMSQMVRPRVASLLYRTATVRSR